MVDTGRTKQNKRNNMTNDEWLENWVPDNACPAIRVFSRDGPFGLTFILPRTDRHKGRPYPSLYTCPITHKNTLPAAVQEGLATKTVTHITETAYLPICPPGRTTMGRWMDGQSRHGGNQNKFVTSRYKSTNFSTPMSGDCPGTLLETHPKWFMTGHVCVFIPWP